MAKGKKASAGTQMTPAMSALLSSIVAATNAGNHEMVPASDEARQLVENGFIEVNTAMTDDAGNAAARATEKGIKFMADQNQNAGAAATPAASDDKPKFAIIKKAPTASRRGSGVRASLYPFDELPAPENGEVFSFFVPATAERPEPWNTLASTVSSASKRYATKTGEETYTTGKGEQKTRATYEYERKFRLVEGEHEGQKGAFVERVK